MEFTELTTEQLNNIMRSCKIEQDFKTDFKRQTIFKVIENKHYILIEKIKGEITKTVQAQNVLTLLLKHC